VTKNLALIAEWREDFSIRHLVMPNHVECCTYPVLECIAEHVPAAPVNVMAQFHADNFCDPRSDKYRENMPRSRADRRAPSFMIRGNARANWA
jgi:putative pyruvate formate lyase activating enzyme